MDEFGVLTERYGLKPQGKSAPMTAPRVDPVPATSSSSDSNSYFHSASSSFDIFGGSGGVSNANSSFDHLDSVFSSSKTSSATQANTSYDVFGSFITLSNQASFAKSSSGDLLGDFEHPQVNPPKEGANDSFNGLDDFVFAPISSSFSSNSYSSEDPFVMASASSAKYEDPLLDFSVKTSNSSSKLTPPPMPGKIIKPHKGSSKDEFQELPTRRSPKATKYKEAEEPSHKLTHDLPFDLLSSLGGSRSISAPKSRVTAQDPFFDLSSPTDTPSSSNHVFPSNGVYDLYTMLGGAQGKLGRAVEEMNNRDSKILQEQEERLRIGEQMDVVIKKWAAGKQGNLRALLSSLHEVVWPECGWKAVARSDVVSPSDVKKLFRKASLCIHPDKVQQKGSSLHERYIAEKVFDILKEAWNKFNRDER